MPDESVKGKDFEYWEVRSEHEKQCPHFNDFLEMTNSHTKGMAMLELTNMNTLESRIVGIRYKRSAKDRGIMFNYCPFCGMRIFKQELVKDDGTDGKAKTKDK